MNRRNGPAADTAPARREPTEEEWSWVCRRLTHRPEGGRYPASMSLLNLVWLAVHEHGWSLPAVGQYRIELMRYNPESGTHTSLHVWRDRLGRFAGAETFTISPAAAKVRDLNRAEALLEGAE